MVILIAKWRAVAPHYQVLEESSCSMKYLYTSFTVIKLVKKTTIPIMEPILLIWI